jgi:hypothetical protein
MTNPSCLAAQRLSKTVCYVECLLSRQARSRQIPTASVLAETLILHLLLPLRTRVGTTIPVVPTLISFPLLAPRPSLCLIHIVAHIVVLMIPCLLFRIKTIIPTCQILAIIQIALPTRSRLINASDLLHHHLPILPIAHHLVDMSPTRCLVPLLVINRTREMKTTLLENGSFRDRTVENTTRTGLWICGENRGNAMHILIPNTIALVRITIIGGSGLLLQSKSEMIITLLLGAQILGEIIPIHPHPTRQEDT